MAHMVCATHVSSLQGEEADLSAITFQNHRMSRSDSATLLVEAIAILGALADERWVASWTSLSKDPNYDQRKKRPPALRVETLTSHPLMITLR